MNRSSRTIVASSLIWIRRRSSHPSSQQLLLGLIVALHEDSMLRRMQCAQVLETIGDFLLALDFQLWYFSIPRRKVLLAVERRERLHEVIARLNEFIQINIDPLRQTTDIAVAVWA